MAAPAQCVMSDQAAENRGSGGDGTAIEPDIEMQAASVHSIRLAPEEQHSMTPPAMDKKYSADGVRQVSEGVLKAPTLKYVAGVSLCPGCGACVGDYYMEEKHPAMKDRLKEVSSSERKKYPRAVAECANPPCMNEMPEYNNDTEPTEVFNPKAVDVMNGKTGYEMKIKTKADKEKKWKNFNTADKVLSVLVWTCGVRIVFPVVAVWTTAPTIMAAKYGLAQLTTGMVCALLSFTGFLYIVKKCCPDTCQYSLKTPAWREAVLNVIDMKAEDVLEKERLGKIDGIAGKLARAEYELKTAGMYLWFILKGFLCCQFCMPSKIFLLGKVLVVMLFTEVGMPVSAWLYAGTRFVAASLTWTMCSFSAWLSEFHNALGMKERIMLMRYPAWGFKRNDEVEGIEKPKIEKPTPQCCGMDCSCLASCENCCSCQKCMACCPCDFCQMSCEMLCPMMCEMFTIFFDMFGDLVSALAIVGKAWWFVERMVKSDTTSGAPDAAKENKV
eukprot:TRINITY_DN547_c0_g1_i4.p1 TRINITY_DN547_c0_g1~~TRINITY_DN547_c0_g1_i4.p1  ORF type:complete len:499 (+),score=92.62 TRINITY_DN547_c0_g1_i4:191-1687(+)